MSESAKKRVICVDLDGTLVKSDTLVEGIFAILRQAPWRIFSLLLGVTKGRLAFKKIIFETVELDPNELPINYEVVDWLKEEKKQGAVLVLATASRKEVAEPVANTLGIFSDILTSTDTDNLKGQRKAEKLTELYGPKGFEYVGDNYVDIPVWKASAKAHVCALHEGVIRQAQAVAPLGKVFKPRKPLVRSLIKAIRPHQWAKNLLVFLPAIMAHEFLPTLRLSALAFMAFCLTASSIYIINDLVDVPADRLHPQKKRRPFASGDLDLRYGIILFPLLATLGLVMGLSVGLKFFCLLVGYVLLTNYYSFVLKRIAIADVLILSGLYTLRIIAGGIATGTEVSNWLMSFSLFLFLSLAFMKRVSEVKLTMASHLKTPRFRDVRLQDLSVSGRDYLVDDLLILSGMGTASGFIAVMVFALYISTLAVRSTYARPDLLWLVCPVLLYWICRAWLLTHRGRMHSDPVAFAVKDRVSLMTLVVLAIIWAAAWWQV